MLGIFRDAANELIYKQSIIQCCTAEDAAQIIVVCINAEAVDSMAPGVTEASSGRTDSGKSKHSAAPMRLPLKDQVELDMTKPTIFQIAINKTEGEKLGLDLEYLPERAILPVRSVLAGHLVATWNLANPTLAVRPGDRVVDINGARGLAATMVQVLGDPESKVVTITFVRPAAEGEYLTDEEVCCHFVTHSQTFGAKQKAADFSLGKAGLLAPSQLGSRLNEALHELPGVWPPVWSEACKQYIHYKSSRTKPEDEPRAEPHSPSSPSSPSGCGGAGARALRKGLQVSFDNNNGFAAGTWKHVAGTYTVSRNQDQYVYEDHAMQVHAFLEEVDGRLEGDLHRGGAVLVHSGAARRKNKEQCIGSIRLQRRGACLVSYIQWAGDGPRDREGEHAAERVVEIVQDFRDDF